MSKKPQFDALGITNKQLKLGKKVAKFGRNLNQIDQTTPYGTLDYSNGGKEVTASFSPAMQGLFNAQTGTGTAAAGAAGGIIGANQGQWAAGPNLGPMMDETGITKAITGWGEEYMRPQLDRERASLEARLTNQGIAPGSAAWQEAINLNDRGAHDAMIKLLLEGQDTALAAGNQNMQKGLAEYNAPLGAYSTLTTGAQPAGMNFVQTPQTAGPSTPDYTGAATTQFNADQQNYQSGLNNLFRIPTAAASWLTGGGLGG
jgi:hypothetical protein